VEVDLHVLRALELHEISGEVGCVDVVALDVGGTHERAMKLLEQPMEPGCLGHAISHNTILILST
jgi:hypothetical protein